VSSRRLGALSHAACHDQAVTEDAATPDVAPDAEADHVDRDYLRKEAWTMGLYVTVCLLAGLTALESVVAIPGHVFGLVWGTTVGLALAHLFAFRLAGRLVHDGRFPRSDQIVSAIQLAAAAVIALVVSIPVLIAPPASELDWARYTCAAIIGVVGYGVARSAHKSRVRAVLFGVAVLALAIIIAGIKHALAGH
jgi:hypothetical protein